MEGEDFNALVADIKANGLRENMILYEGKILDGRNRYLAAKMAGFKLEYFHFNEPFKDIQRKTKAERNAAATAYVISANIHRRHLTAEQKRELVEKLIKAQPEKPDRQIAKTAKVDHKTVGTARVKLEGRGEIPHVETRTDTKGRKQPAKKATKKAEAKQPVPKPVKHDDRVISPELGEQVGRLAHKLIKIDIGLARELADLILKHGVAERLWNDLDTGLKIEDVS
jgi:hypothetical protein